MSGGLDDFTFFETPPMPLTHEWVREGAERILARPRGVPCPYAHRLQMMVLRAIAGGWCETPRDCANETLRISAVRSADWPINA